MISRHGAGRVLSAHRRVLDSDEETSPDTEPDTESAKDRLLAVLLGEPRAAMTALAAVDDNADNAASDDDVTALLASG